jgi:hypothetical protein
MTDRSTRVLALVLALGATSAAAQAPVFSTFVGGADSDRGFAVAAAPNGDVVVAGSTLSTNLPTTPGVFGPRYHGEHTLPRPVGDIWVARFSPAGALRWATYLGGSENEHTETVECTPDGDVVVAGWTTSTDYPTTPGAYDRTHNGTGGGYQFWGGDLCVTRIAGDGSRIVWSTFVGGEDLEYVNSMDVDATGAVTFAGHVHSFTFPTTPNAHRRAMTGYSDSFISRLDPTGSILLQSTYWGGSDGEEYPRALEVLPDGSTVFAGGTTSTDLPVTPGAAMPTYSGGMLHPADGYVGKLDPTGAQVVFCTYVGTPQDEEVLTIAADRDGSVLVAGPTNSPSFPTTPGAFDRSHGGGWDGFVIRLDPAGTAFLFSTYLGGASDDELWAIRADGSGAVIVSGVTGSLDFPTTPGAYASSPPAHFDVAVVRLDPTGARLLDSTLLGGPNWERGDDCAVMPDGDVVVGGTSYSSSGFPLTPGGRAYAGGGDTFMTRLPLLASGLSRSGTGTPGCSGLPWLGASPMPRVGAADFAVRGGRAVPGARGLVCLGLGLLPAPLPLLGVPLHVDPARWLACPGVTADARGGSTLALAIPGDPVLGGAVLFAQGVWLDPCAPSGFAASGALRVEVRP